MDNTNRSSRGRNVPDTTDAPRHGGAGAPAQTLQRRQTDWSNDDDRNPDHRRSRALVALRCPLRVVDISNQHAVVDLCTCTGEPLERLQTEDPAVIGYLRTAHCDLDLS
jgi:hypothetical protein